MTNPSVKLIIFDKDGTLVDFHRMWMPYARATVKLLEQATGRDVGPSVYKTLGVDPHKEKVSMGALAEKTLDGIRKDVALTLMDHGIPHVDAHRIVEHAVPEQSPGETWPVCDLQILMEELRQMGVKMALCTADSRTATMAQMKLLRIEHYMDHIVCGNDQGIIPKPSPHCAVQICKKLNVELKDAIMVGDTIADLKMGRVAGLRASVGVLTGVGNRDSLSQYTDYFIENVSELPGLINNKINEDTKRG
ncbi:unnamed protein product, partial [Mesorhabditis belari]|uniref:Uncharacterized protein n=1 Tax=Mesorhabditis belari TaxID=2138241 RepID=A0AAF3EFW2_9BILA